MADEYLPGDDLVHDADGVPTFQDSHWLMWLDEAAGIGGLHRLGASPARGAGAVLIGIVTTSGRRFKRSSWDVAWSRPDDHAYVVGAHRVDLGDDQWHLQVREPECTVDLRWSSQSALFAYGADETVATAHFEGAGRVTGRVALDGDCVQIDAAAFRDRSWGPRDYGAIRAHRWFAGTFGPELTFSALTLLRTDGSVHREGIVIDHDGVHRATEIDVLLWQEVDGFSHRGGSLSMRFEDREDLEVTTEVVDGLAFALPGGAGHTVEVMCVAHADGRRGFCNVEASNNIERGGEPLLSVGAGLTDGLSRRPASTASMQPSATRRPA